MTLRMFIVEAALIVEVSQLEESSNHIIGCVKYEWMKFNFWDWREADWEDYDIENVHSGGNNSKYEKQKLAKESGVRSDYFVRILDLCVLHDCVQRGLGSQLLKSLIYAFPSGTRFGVEVPATNTVAVKCFTRCGFSISRIEQGSDAKYKMRAESHFSFDSYLSFVRNSCVTPPKVINMMQNTQQQQRSPQ